MSKRNRTDEEKERARAGVIMFLEHTRLLDELDRQKLTFSRGDTTSIAILWNEEEVAKIDSLDGLYGFLSGLKAAREINRLIALREAVAHRPLGRFVDRSAMRALQAALTTAIGDATDAFAEGNIDVSTLVDLVQASLSGRHLGAHGVARIRTIGAEGRRAIGRNVASQFGNAVASELDDLIRAAAVPESPSSN